MPWRLASTRINAEALWGATGLNNVTPRVIGRRRLPLNGDSSASERIISRDLLSMSARRHATINRSGATVLEKLRGLGFRDL